MRASFVLSEIGIGLRRNLTMTIAVIVTVAISLALFGSGLLLREQVATMKNFWYDKVEVSIFLSREVTGPQREQLDTELRQMPQVADVFYESRDQAYQRFSKQFEDDPELVRSVTPDLLAESFRVKLKNPERDYAVVASAFTGKPGVEEVLDERRTLDSFFTVLNGLQIAALVVALVQVVAAAFLISNTIRVAAYSRRRETGIMRLVGASNLYIQLPFLLEGALAGLIGASVAVGAMIGLQHFIIDERLRPAFGRFVPFVGWDETLQVVPLLVVVGVALSALASFVTLRKYLRV